MDSPARPVLEDPPSSHAQGQIIEDGYQMITETLNEPLFQLHCEADVTPTIFVVFDVFPFAAGAQRLAFRGSIYERRVGASPVFHVHCVVKMEMATGDYLSRGLSERTRVCDEEAEKTILKHERTREYVDKWCALGINKSVYVLSAEKVRITKGCSVSDIDPVTFPILHHLFRLLSLDAVLYERAVGTVEDQIPGKFTKFLNNDGQSNRILRANFPAAFAHWTWVASKGDLMITDIQGVRTGKGYILTDPCVHAVQDTNHYGLSDLGWLGIKEFFNKHNCNELCQDLGLASDGKDLDVGQSLRTRIARVASEGNILAEARRMEVQQREDVSAIAHASRSRSVRERGKSEKSTGDREPKLSVARRASRKSRRDQISEKRTKDERNPEEEARGFRMLWMFRKRKTTINKGGSKLASP